ncbi:hypothetical protein NHP164001_15040 [Helicobacter trogontum]|uniref:HTH marR-type domain-containing protein n=1 Tax=Helicobacter trogontum TaxID=50960 RepID=A0ABQ0D5P1_9HELI
MTYSIDDKMEDELYAEVLEKIELFQKEHIVPHLMLAARKMKKFAIGHLKRFHIGFEQMAVLHALSLAKELNINQLAKILQKDRGTVSRCVESLCAKEYVIKTKPINDQRIHVVRLTQSGEQFFIDVCHYFERIAQKPESAMNICEIKQFHESLEKIIDYCKNTQKVTHTDCVEDTD